ncbi:MAG: ImmA/IrrE family metallo-endopeptidase [Pleomorphochaeta sp.]
MVNNKFDDYVKNNIARLAQEEKRKLGYIGSAPIANDLVNLLDQLNIILIETPIASDNNNPAFSAAMLYSENQGLAFIGLNSADYYDNQLFSLSHELYHYFTKSGYHLSRINDEKNNQLELEANFFAAEFILPKDELLNIVIKEFKIKTLKNIKLNIIIRFIAKLYCKWWLPYVYIIEELFEIKAITKNQRSELLEVDVRSTNSNFSKICKAINSDSFYLLNSITNKNTTSFEIIEVIIKNFEDNLISEDEFEQILQLFNLSPSDFGYESEIAQDDIDELESFFNGDLKDEG